MDASGQYYASMKRRTTTRTLANVFEPVRMVGLTLAGVTLATRYDGSPVLKLDGCFMAGLAMHHSAEPETLVVRASFEERQWLIEDAPETYYVTDYYRNHPVVLARLARLDRDALHDLLMMSWRLTVPKTRTRRSASALAAERAPRTDP
jgi:hypothetical protein